MVRLSDEIHSQLVEVAAANRKLRASITTSAFGRASWLQNAPGASEIRDAFSKLDELLDAVDHNLLDIEGVLFSTAGKVEQGIPKPPSLQEMGLRRSMFRR
jgi:hypothetical protein